jgi:hypothetical protein
MLMYQYLIRLKQLLKNGQFSRFTVEISLLLAVKFLLLWGLWIVCFSHAQPKALIQTKVSEIILNKTSH